MQNQGLFFEVTPLEDRDCFVVIERHKDKFDFPIHVHDAYELNFVGNAKGARRVVGDSVEIVGNQDLVLVANDKLEHAWFDYENSGGEDICEITIQFSPSLFEGGLIDTRQFLHVKELLNRAQYGVAFSPETIKRVMPLLRELTTKYGSFSSIIIFLTLLNELGNDYNSRVLSNSIFAKTEITYSSQIIQMVMNYIQDNYMHSVRMGELARMCNMSNASFSRFIKLHTGRNGIDWLNDLRLSMVARRLIDDPTSSIGEIAMQCGFNNVSNFNQIFKKKKGFTPRYFREYYMKKKINV